MAQKLSAMKYIKNNKRRVSVLLVSLSLCFVLFYIANFLLSSMPETFGHLLIENAKKVQYVIMPYYAYGLNSEVLETLGEEGFLKQAYNADMELKEKLKNTEEVKEVFYAPVNYMELSAVAGQFYVEIPMLAENEVQKMMNHFNAKLVEGKMPENDNEVILDEKLIKNGSYQIGDSIIDYPESKIVGVVQSDYYFGCGVFEGEKHQYYDYRFVIFSDGSIENIADFIRELGYEFETKDASIIDVYTGREALQKDVVDAISCSTNIIYVVIIVVLSLAIVIVYITYLRDRYNEWCLYCSIGFSRKTIYFSVMRELFFTFGIAILIGVVVATIAVIVLDYTLLQSMGLMCRYFYPDTLLEILCSYALILGVLQIPIRIALYKIRTIDAMDDELNE